VIYGHDVLTPRILASAMLQIGVGKGSGALDDGEDTEIDELTLPAQHQTNDPCSMLGGGVCAALWCCNCTSGCNLWGGWLASIPKRQKCMNDWCDHCRCGRRSWFVGHGGGVFLMI
jgi:hypothetical protein